MAKLTLEEKENKIKIMEQEIKEEKKKIDERLGKEIISALNLNYSEIDKDIIIQICNILKIHYVSKD